MILSFLNFKSVDISFLISYKDIEFQEKSVSHNLKWMRWFEKKLKLLNLEFQTSVTNFLLIKFPKEGLYSAQNAV